MCKELQLVLQPDSPVDTLSPIKKLNDAAFTTIRFPGAAVQGCRRRWVLAAFGGRSCSFASGTEQIDLELLVPVIASP